MELRVIDITVFATTNQQVKLTVLGIEWFTQKFINVSLAISNAYAKSIWTSNGDFSCCSNSLDPSETLFVRNGETLSRAVFLLGCGVLCVSIPEPIALTRPSPWEYPTVRMPSTGDKTLLTAYLS